MRSFPLYSSQSVGQKKTSSTTIKPELNSAISNGVKLITKKIMKRFSLDLEDVMFSHNRHRDENGKWKREKNEGMKNYICDKKKSCFCTYGPDAGLCIRNLYNILDLII